MLIKRLKEKFKQDEPIFTKEILSVMSDYSRPRVFQLINFALKNNELVRFDNGVYCFPSKYGGTSVSLEQVVRKKYITNKDDVYGIYAGLSLDVYFLLSTQIPQTIEIITNNETMNVRELKFKNRKVVLKKSRVKITKENENAYKIMEFFSKLDVNDFLKDNMCKREVVSFIKENKITYSNIYALAPYFPTKSIKNMVKCGVYDEIAQ